MRFVNSEKTPLRDESLEKEYRCAQKLFSVRIGERHLFVPRLFKAVTLSYADMTRAYLQMEFVECATSEFPGEYYIYRTHFMAGERELFVLVTDTHEKAKRILTALHAAAPEIEVYIPAAPQKL